MLRAAHIVIYTEDAGLKIPIGLCIASPFSRQIAIGNAGPVSALESMEGKPTFRCQKKFGLGP